jgi:hypothetical protein
MNKQYLIGKIVNFESFKSGPGKETTYIHLATKCATENRMLEGIQVDCKMKLSSKAKYLKNKKINHIFVEYVQSRERIRNGRNQITVIATEIEVAKNHHYKHIKKLLRENHLIEEED